MSIARILLLLSIFPLFFSSLTRAADVIQTQSSTSGSVDVDVIKAAVKQGVLTIQVACRNTGDENVAIQYDLGSIYYVDESEKKKYHVIRDSAGCWLASHASGTFAASATEQVVVRSGGNDHVV
jgi:hypothetical protein